MTTENMNKTPSIILNDKTRTKLFFASDFLFFLNSKKLNIRLHLNHARSLYGNYFQFFPNIQVMERYVPVKNNGNEIHIDFIDKLDNINPMALNFPILSKDQAAEYERTAQNNKLHLIPLSHEQTAGFKIAELESAKDMLFRCLKENDFLGRRFLISAGPTAEDIDPVRFLTNRATGKMGIALARAAFRRGAEVNLVMGPSALKIPRCLQSVSVRSAKDMADTVIPAFSEADIYIGCAAVADYTPQNTSKNKIKKSEDSLTLTLDRTTDILKALDGVRKKQIMVGFSVETTAELENSKRKLQSKNLDMIVINNPRNKGAAFGGDTNLVTILSKNDRCETYPLMSKLAVSEIILDWIKEL